MKQSVGTILANVLPGGVDLAVGEGVGRPGSIEQRRDGRPGRDVLLWIVNEKILNGQLGD